MDRELLYQRFKLSLDILDEVRDNYEKVDIWTKVSQFMNGTMEIYLALKADPSIREDPEFQHYISKSAGKLTWFTNYIVLFMSKIEQDLHSTFYDNEWLHLCSKRSSIDALKEMYRNTCLEEHFPDIDTEDLDDHMSSVGDYEGYLSAEKIPAGIPHSHWWWWYPEKPETSQQG
jgi:hypothetical protein